MQRPKKMQAYLFMQAIDLIVQFVRAEGGALFLLDDVDASLVCKASAGPVDIRGISLQAGEGIVGQCVTENSSRIVRDSPSNIAPAAAAINGTLSCTLAALVDFRKGNAVYKRA